MARTAAAAFKLWTPGPLDAVRRYLLSEKFQGAAQLAVGILFVSLFVFVERLRFPTSCVGVVLYIVVAVTAAPDNHVGTRIWLCGFMMGPMWLALITGGLVGTLARLAPTPLGHLIALSLLGPLAIVPFAVTRVGTSHPFMWAMGMVSALYLGLPILAGFNAPSLTIFWQRSVGFIFVAALIAMFAGSVLSIIVLPSLASHKLEAQVAYALNAMGHHLSHTVSQIMRQQQQQNGQVLPLPKHLQTVHPLVQQSHKLQAGCIAPGILDKDANEQVSPAEVYAAVMDWFEHMSRPQQDKSASITGLAAVCRARRSSSAASSTQHRSTFYGSEATGLEAAAVAAAAAADSLGDWADADMAGSPTADIPDTPLQNAHTAASSTRVLSGNVMRGISNHMQSKKASDTVLPELVPSMAPSRSSSLVSGLPVCKDTLAPAKSGCKDTVDSSGSLPTCKDTNDNSGGMPTGKDTGSISNETLCKDTQVATHLMCKDTIDQPAPILTKVREALAHANQLLEPAKAEPQWLRGSERLFDAEAWTKVIAAAQVLASRLSALDLLQRDHMLLLDSSHSFPVSGPLELTLQSIYGTAAAALSLLAAEVADWGEGSVQPACKPAAALLQLPEWSTAREQLWQLSQQELVNYWQRVQSASEAQPATLPRATWVRQCMFFLLATKGVMDALESLVAAAAAAVNAPQQSRTFVSRRLRGMQQQRQTTFPFEQYQKDSTGRVRPHPQNSDAAAPVACEAPADVETAPVATSTNDAAALLQQTPSPNHPPLQLLQQHKDQGMQGYLGVRKLVTKHTGWMMPWMPLALNVKQFEHLYRTATRDLPHMFSSKAVLVAQLRGRRFQAGLKYWFVCSSVMVAILLVQHYIPTAYRYAPNFGYSAAAVGMSDRVESTVYKVCIWVASSTAGAILGWALMSTAAMANDAVALAAVICCVAFVVGSLGRSRNMLVTFLTLMTFASIVLCQYVGCCGHTGSTVMAIVRGGSVMAAALFSVAVQNLIWPWYTSSWALEQLGQTYHIAAEMLADLVYQLYKDTDDQIKQQVQGSDLGSDLCKQQVQGSVLAGGVSQISSTIAKMDAAARMRRLDEAIGRVLQQQQQQTHAVSQAADDQLATSGTELCQLTPYTGSGSGLNVLQGLLEQRRHTALSSHVAAQAAGVEAAASAGAAGGKAQTLSSLAQLHAKLVKPLVQVKMSLVLDTTAWTSGPFATPTEVTRILGCMFDVADALGALQQALSLQVNRLSGNWSWVLQHMAEPWGQLLSEVLLMSDALVRHLQQPGQESAADLLRQIQRVQHKRYEFFQQQRKLRCLVHIAVASDDQLFAEHIADQSTWQLEDPLRFSGTIYATAKVLDKMTAAARCAFGAGN